MDLGINYVSSYVFESSNQIRQNIKLMSDPKEWDSTDKANELKFPPRH